MSAVRGAVSLVDRVCSSYLAVGLITPRPSWQAGSDRTSRSMSEMLSLPVSTGKNCWRMVSSSGCIRRSMPSMDLEYMSTFQWGRGCMLGMQHEALILWRLRGVQALLSRLRLSRGLTLHLNFACRWLHIGDACLCMWYNYLCRQRLSQHLQGFLPLPRAWFWNCLGDGLMLGHLFYQIVPR